MKLFYATSARLPGAKAHCSQIAQMCRSFSQVGEDIELLHPRRAVLPIYGDKSIKEWYGFELDIPHKALKCIDSLSSLPAGLPGYLYHLAFKLMVGTFNHSLIKYLKKYQKLYEKEFVVYTRDQLVFEKLRKAFPEIKMIMEFHHLEEMPGKVYELENKIITSADGLVVLTTIMKEMLVERGVNVKKILVESSAVDPVTFPGGISREEARKKLDITCRGKIVAYIGNFHTLGLEKGLDTIVKSIPTVVSAYEDVSYYFVGGPMKYAEDYIGSLERNGVDRKHYRFFDRQPYNKISLWLAAADILVMPLPDHPRFSKNTSPMKIFEYMTSGRPMVMSDLPAFRGVLVHEENALLVPPQSVDAFSSAILRLLNDNDLSEKLAENALSDVQLKTWDARALRIKNWMEDLDS